MDTAAHSGAASDAHVLQDDTDAALATLMGEIPCVLCAVVRLACSETAAEPFQRL